MRDCVARDVANINVVKLTDEHGCILRPKLIGAFQKTRDTGASGSSIIAYAFFQVKCNLCYIQKRCIIVIKFIVTLIKHRGTAVAQWLRRCATNQKVTDSIPAGVTGIFH